MSENDNTEKYATTIMIFFTYFPVIFILLVPRNIIVNIMICGLVIVD